MPETARTVLCAWSERHLQPLAAMHMDVEVMRDYGDTLDRQASARRLAHFMDAQARSGFGRWALEDRGGNFLGYVGVMPSPPGHPLGVHFDIGWRLVRPAWGFGYATEAARAALADFFARHTSPEVLAYTATDNIRSQAVMERLGLVRDADRDFTMVYGSRTWSGLVWIAGRSAFG